MGVAIKMIFGWVWLTIILKILSLKYNYGITLTTEAVDASKDSIHFVVRGGAERYNYGIWLTEHPIHHD